jgi:uncharacterized Fe-S center protein
MSKVMIHSASYENVRQAVDRALELFPLKLKGKKILIKPNVLKASKAEEGITTHPAVLRAVVEKIETLQPAGIVVGDNPGAFSYGANEESFKKTGLMEAAVGYYQNIGSDSQNIDFNADFMPTVNVSRIVLEADIIISLPKFKTHGLTTLSGAIKNSYGILPGAQKAKEAGLGVYDLNKIKVIGEMKKLPDFKLPPLGGETSMSNKPLQDQLQRLTLLLPQADPELCTGCGTCVDQCAAMALSMNDNLPQVDADNCITCFCCQEMCPEKAMTLK